jgi:hypothetical protein
MYNLDDVTSTHFIGSLIVLELSYTEARILTANEPMAASKKYIQRHEMISSLR